MPDPQFARTAWLRALARTASIQHTPQRTLPVVFETLADRFGAAPALLGESASLDYAGLAGRAWSYARWALSRGVRPGEVIALSMPNCPEYLAVWLGLIRIGAVVALLNPELVGEAREQALQSARPRWVLDGTADGVISMAGEPLCGALATFAGGAALSTAECALPTLEATALLIYTSGTTGLPKAAKVSHYRLMQWTHWFAGLLDTSPADRMYNCLPLYHSVGGVVACGATLLGGGTVILRRKFSVTEFWREVRAERCTLFQYIGELCRYLLNSPHRPEETEHHLRIACGNGLRPEIWEAFRTRFRIPRILEYYAATEGSFSLYNCEGEPGAIGRVPPFLAHRVPVTLVRFDPVSQQPLRNAAGQCERCAVDEVGEALGALPGPATRPGNFEGYTDEDASAKKILRDVFAAGDAWYRTGDLMRRDARGYFFFVDRIGATYRWKGENVSMAQVQDTVRGAPGVRDAMIYGVALPGIDGRAGMAAFVIDDDFDLTTFAAHVAALPPFARPVFLRLVPRLETTATFKPLRLALTMEGCDPSRVRDPLYVMSDVSEAVGTATSATAYRPLDAALYARILAGELRL